MDIVFINTLGKANFFYIVEYLVQFVQADEIFMMFDVAVDAILYFIVMEKTIFLSIIAETVLIFFGPTIPFGGHYLLNVHVFPIFSFFNFVHLLFSVDGRVMPI